MADYYIHKQTKREYPNTLRMFNKNRKRKTGTAYSVMRMKKSGWPDPVGMFASLASAITGANNHGKKRGIPVNIRRK